MKLSINWLKDFVDISEVPPKKLADELTMSGSKVETVEQESKNIKNIVVGKILDINPHPNADKLVVCSVQASNFEESSLQIVTGAKNLKIGDLVPVALHNSTIFDGRKIKKGKLRDVESEGMLCSLGELGLSKSDFPYAVEDGIFVLNEVCSPGDDIKKVLEIDDIILEFEITSNRPDCMSILGLANEVACTINKDLKLKIVKSFQNFNTNHENIIEVNVENSDLCKRYLAVHIKDIKIGPSPKWMRNRLRVCGVKPINNIVDITNYVMLEYGNPLHAFDYEKISGKEINIRKAKNNEKILALNNEEYNLDEEVLIISDKDKPIAIAGIIGGINSSITEETSSIVLESALFDATNIRQTSKKLNLRTDSSLRFEKDLNSVTPMDAMSRACSLIEELNIGKIEKKPIDINNSRVKSVEIHFDSYWINNYLGTKIEETHMIDILRRLGFKVDKDTITVPHFRTDVENKFDIAEEVARIYGYNNIPSTPLSGISEAKLDEFQKFERKLRDIVIGCGCYEVSTYSFISEKHYDRLNIPRDDNLRDYIKILNPLGEDTSIMRTTAIPSMVDILSLNFNNRNLEVMFFDLSNEYIKNHQGDLPHENKKLIIGLYGKDFDFFSIKGIVEIILNRFNISDYDVSSKKDNPIFHPGRCCIIEKDGLIIGTVGELHPNVADNYSVNCKSYIADIDVLNIFNLSRIEKKYIKLPKFPHSCRDLGLICEKTLPIINIEKSIKNSVGRMLEDIELVDIYEGEQIPDDKKSVCYSISMRNSEATLTDGDIEKIISKILKDLENIQVYLRR